MSPSAKTVVQVEGRELTLSNLDKQMYGAANFRANSPAFTKGDVIHYYQAIAPAILEHLRGRPLTFKRYPDGAQGEFFYEKRCPKHRPDWVQTASIWSSGNDAYIDYCLANDLPTLVWAANLASLELHVSLSRAEQMESPSAMAFDLDPGPPATIVECCKVGLLLRELFEGWGLQSFPKTSGSKGLQIYVPLNDTAITYEQTKPFAKALAQLLEKQHPKLVVSKMAKDLRGGKVLLDWSQNDRKKTTVCVYSLRAKERPTVSTPLTWDEVEAGAHSRSKDGSTVLRFTAHDVLERFDQHGDLFAPVETLVQGLPDLG